MKRIGSIVSAGLFLLSMAGMTALLLGNDSFLLMSVLSALLGFLIGLFADKGAFKRIGVLGNGAILIVTVLFPFFVTTFFWNTP
ncbi:hypothetical protein [Halobacillus litoralis]|uniref:hypothetical protein n=1 Tax=Halobacillus litoralis TaxID=45668 RepID=UPI001CFEC037|nr:hypothetical protein [Halobacillus litoralis]